MATYKAIKNLKQEVGAMLAEHPETRDSDITLMLYIWRKHYPQAVDDRERIYIGDLYDLPREDNIKRVRAYWQNTKKMYLPTTWAVAKARKINEDEWRVAMGYPINKPASVPPSWTPPSERKDGRYCSDCQQTIYPPVAGNEDGNCVDGGTHHYLFPDLIKQQKML